MTKRIRLNHGYVNLIPLWDGMGAKHYTTTSTFYEFSLSSLMGSKVRVLVQDLYGSQLRLCNAYPLAKMRKSNSGTYLCMPLVLPTQPYKIYMSSIPSFSRAGWALQKRSCEPYRSWTNTLTFDPTSDERENS